MSDDNDSEHIWTRRNLWPSLVERERGWWLDPYLAIGGIVRRRTHTLFLISENNSYVRLRIDVNVPDKDIAFVTDWNQLPVVWTKLERSNGAWMTHSIHNKSAYESVHYIYIYLLASFRLDAVDFPVRIVRNIIAIQIKCKDLVFSARARESDYIQKVVDPWTCIYRYPQTHRTLLFQTTYTTNVVCVC